MSEANEDDAKPKRAGNPAWRAGVSGNPAGRPRAGQTLADALRAKCTPEIRASLLIDMAIKAESEQVRLAARLAIIERCDGRVPTTTQVELTTQQRPTFDVSKLSLERQRELLAIIREARAEAERADSPALVEAGDSER